MKTEEFLKIRWGGIPGLRGHFPFWLLVTAIWVASFLVPPGSWWFQAAYISSWVLAFYCWFSYASDDRVGVIAIMILVFPLMNFEVSVKMAYGHSNLLVLLETDFLGGVYGLIGILWSLRLLGRRLR